MTPTTATPWTSPSGRSPAGLLSCCATASRYAATLSGADGFYAFTNVTPNYVTTISYSVRFRAPGAVRDTALLGMTDSDFTDGLQRIDDIEVQEGSLWDDLNMPVDPHGVIYNSVSRTPVSGATADDGRRAQRPARARAAASTIRISRARSRSATATTSST